LHQIIVYLTTFIENFSPNLKIKTKFISILTAEVLTPQQSISPIYQEHYLVRREIDLLKSELCRLFSRIDESESEEHFKNIAADFLKVAFYKADYEVNTKNRKDLVIHNGKSTKDPVGVIIEAKKPSNKAEMFSAEKPNVKALHELILYYFDEREEKNNIEIKHLIITNLYEWFVFDENEFDKIFYRNTEIRKLYKSKKEQGKDNPFFYAELAKILSQIADSLRVTYFNLKDYQHAATLPAHDEQDLVFEHLWKVLSPAHLLKLPLGNDANTLNQPFYHELLHILGLEEVIDYSQGGRKLIKRIQKENQRSEGSFMENTLYMISLDKKWQELPNLKEYGDTPQEQLEEIAISLCITWLNRILFLKLLEGQLITYKINGQVIQEKEQRRSANPVDLSRVRFMNLAQIKDFDELHELFFEVLAVKKHERNKVVSEKFGEIPYLNSSLFEEIELEQKVLKINQLKNRLEIPLYEHTVLKKNGKRLTGRKRALEYLFEFLEAFDFAKIEKNKIQEESKDLINSAVLGLVFEQLNGYKEGSFFTPSFITMYMCRETIRKVVVQKFKQASIGFGGDSFEDLKMFLSKDNYLSEKLKLYNKIFNSIKICDPAVGSGHFLVSALNELIACKSELQIIATPENQLLGFLQIEVQNDELRIKNLQLNEEHEYRKPPPNLSKKPYYQVIQETIFHEKKTLMENCLFGVDINPNSVKICRLRLWIELLKNAYYQAAQTPKGFKYEELETLPNIDINIKVGNSLISRFAIDDKYHKLANGARQKLRLATQKYKEQVIIYKNTTDSQTKQNAEKEIANIKKLFSTVANPYDKDYQLLKEKEAQLGEMPLFFDRKEQEIWIENTRKLTQEIEILRKKHEEKIQTVYGRAFEWRFEFPEVLNEDGDFEGFDFVVGNPPYFTLSLLTHLESLLSPQYQTYIKGGDIYCLFYEKAVELVRPNGLIAFITSKQWLNAAYGKPLRKFLEEKVNPLTLIDFGQIKVFDRATVFVNILVYERKEPMQQLEACILPKSFNKKEDDIGWWFDKLKTKVHFSENTWKIGSDLQNQINQKMEQVGTPLKDWEGIQFYRGITTGLNEAFHIDEQTKEYLISQDAKNEEIIKPLLRGRNIKKYAYKYENLYMLFIPWHFPLHQPANIIGASKEAEVLFQKNYPAIYTYLERFKDELISRNSSETNIRYEWYALQRYGSMYYEEFEKPKLVWLEISDRANYAYDEQGMYLTNSAYFLTSKQTDLKFLLAILNSKLVDFYFSQITAKIAGGRKRYTKQYVEQIPIPPLSAEEQAPFVALVEQILAKKQQGEDTSDLENEIDEKVFALYGLTEEEKYLVLNS